MHTRAYGSGTPTDSVTSNTQGSDHYISRTGMKMHSGAYATSRRSIAVEKGGGGCQEFQTPLDYGRSARPELGMRIGRFEDSSRPLGPPGRRGAVHRLEQRLGQL
jgi:hypothetical protein